MSEKLYSIKYVTIDDKVFENELSINRLNNILDNLKKYDLKYYGFISDQEIKSKFREKLTERNLNIDFLEYKNYSDLVSKIIKIEGKKKLSLGEKISLGKKILHLGTRNSNFIDNFTPPKGIVCYPFKKVIWQTECPFDCAYCFLQLTFRITPFSRVYLNLEKLFKEMNNLDSKLSSPILLNSGELSDPLALDHVTGITNEVINQIETLKNINLLLLTKSSNIDHLKPVNDGKVVFSVSLTTPENAAMFEKHSASPEERIEALRKAELKGYRTRVRIDPIITYYEDWEKQYEKIIEKLFNETNVELITLGQPRFYKPLVNIIKGRYQEIGEYFDNLVIDNEVGHGKKIEYDKRVTIYSKIYNLVNKYSKDKNIKIAVCKEELKLNKDVGACIGKCNCLL